MSKRKYREEFDEYMSDEEYKMMMDDGESGITKSMNEIIFNLRKIYGYTQEEVAKKLDIKQNTLSRYEQGGRQIPFKMLAKILGIYGLKIDIVPINENDNDALNKFFSAWLR